MIRWEKQWNDVIANQLFNKETNWFSPSCLRILSNLYTERVHDVMSFKGIPTTCLICVCSTLDGHNPIFDGEIHPEFIQYTAFAKDLYKWS